MKVSLKIVIIIALIAIAGCTKDRNEYTNSIPNGDFENWSDNLLLANWNTNSCPMCDPPFETYIVQKDSSAFHGKFAAKFIYNNVYAARAENKFPLSVHPLFLGACIKCNLYGADTVSVKIKLFKNMAVVDSGEWLGTSSITDYRQINFPISQHSLQIDSALIRITGGHIAGPSGKNTEMWVDYLTLE